MRFVIIENGIAVNAAIAEQALADNWIASDTASIGDLYQDGQFTTPDPVIDPEAYKEQRSREYPPMADYIDGIVKGDTAQVQAYINACLAVKAKYPKPE
jgi:hypothetical protein